MDYIENLTSQQASAILLAKLFVLSPLTSIFRIKSGRFISSEDTKVNPKRTSVGETNIIRRIRNAQRNDIENTFTAVLVLALSATTYDSKFLAVLVGSRIFHSIFYLLGMQPWRGIMFMVNHFQVYYMLWNFYQESMNGGNHFNVVLSLILFNMHVMNIVTGLSRKVFGSPQAGIPEDVKLQGLDKPPSDQNETCERLLMASNKNIYYSFSVITLAILAKDSTKINLPVNEITSILYFYLYSRVANHASILFGLPNGLKMVTFFGSIFYASKFVCPWDLCGDFLGAFGKVETLLVVLMAKGLLVACIEQVYNLFHGQLDMGRDQVLNPTRHMNDENIRMINIQRNDAENALVFVSLLLLKGIENVPFNYIYYFVIARCVHTAVYVLHVPQPARAISYFVGVYYTFKVFMMFF